MRVLVLLAFLASAAAAGVLWMAHGWLELVDLVCLGVAVFTGLRLLRPRRRRPVRLLRREYSERKTVEMLRRLRQSWPTAVREVVGMATEERFSTEVHSAARDVLEEVLVVLEELAATPATSSELVGR